MLSEEVRANFPSKPPLNVAFVSVPFSLSVDNPPVRYGRNTQLLPVFGGGSFQISAPVKPRFIDLKLTGTGVQVENSFDLGSLRTKFIPQVSFSAEYRILLNGMAISAVHRSGNILVSENHLLSQLQVGISSPIFNWSSLCAFSALMVKKKPLVFSFPGSRVMPTPSFPSCPISLFKLCIRAFPESQAVIAK